MEFNNINPNLFWKNNLFKFSPLAMLLAFCLKFNKPHNSFNIHRNLMRIVLFERSYKYLTSLKIPQEEKIY